MKPFDEIIAVTNLYFNSIFNGNVEGLLSAFHPNATLSGVVKGEASFNQLEDYLFKVKNRQSPKDLGETFAMKVLSIEVLGQVAYVKTNCPMLGFNYYDYLSFICIEGRWVISSKVFTDK